MNYEKFQNLGLSEATLKELQKKGFEEPTEIQEKVIPALLSSNQDIIGQAQTGTGKTAAFGLPLIEKLEKKNFVQALILAPTRELAIQVSEEINSFKGKKKFRIIPIYGGQSMNEQLRRLESGVDVVVGTPGRVLDHIKRKSLKLGDVMYVVLDEADEMLNMGFIDDVEEILSFTNPARRTLLFSATMPDRIKNIAKKYMRDYVVISAKNKQLTVDLTDQIYFEVNTADKFESLCRIIDVADDFYGLIFCRTKAAVDELYNKLIDRGYESEGIHGDLSQSQRERILDKFKKRRTSILVATDVAARGLDVTDLTHVINYSLPQDPESYVHRIGRTGRAGKKGIAITFISPSEYRKLMHISSETKTNIRKEKIPGIAEIINIKRSRIKTELSDLIEAGSHEAYIETALQMIEEHDPVNVLAALLKYSLEDVLNEKKYKDITNVSGKSSGKSSGKNEEFGGRGLTRLFVSFGKKDGISPKKLLKLVNNATGTPGGKVTGIIVKDSYSFLTVPYGEAEKIIKAFSQPGEKKPLIQKAEEGQKPAKSRNDKKKKKNRN